MPTTSISNGRFAILLCSMFLLQFSQFVTVSAATCPTVPDGKRVVVYWQTEVGGCETLPEGVTHIIWGFSLVGANDDTAGNQLQGYTPTLKQCILTLQSRCIKSLISIGGYTNIANFATINNATKFAQSALDLIEEYNLDGIDIDDENVGSDFDPARVIGYMKALHSALNTPTKKYLLTYADYLFAADEDKCSGTRCFPKEIAQYVDWINVMAYNVDTDSKVAYNTYFAVPTTYMPMWSKAVGDPRKVVMGACVPESCAYGVGPFSLVIGYKEETVVNSWSAASLDYGGMMIYAASKDLAKDYEGTKSVIDTFARF